MANAFRYQHLRSVIKDVEPSVTLIREGEIAVNLYAGEERLFIKNTNNQIVKFISEAQIDSKIQSQTGGTDGKIAALSGVVTTNTADIAALEANKFGAVAYDKANKKLNFLDDANGAVIGYISTDDFVKDGMIDSVELVQLSGDTYIRITWNTDAGKEITELNIGDMFDADNYYTKAETYNKTEINQTVNNLTNIISESSGKSVTEIISSNDSIHVSTAETSDGTVKVDIKTDASRISGLTAVSDSDRGNAKISGVTTTDSVKKGIENLYKSISSEVEARKAAILARTISSANKGIKVTENPNADGFNTSLELTLDTTTNGVGNEKVGNDNALTITENGLFLSTNWNCGDF